MLVGTIQEVVREKVMPTMVEIWKTEGIAEIVLMLLRSKFAKVPRRIENAIRSMRGPTALDSLAIHVTHCQSLKEFAKALN